VEAVGTAVVDGAFKVHKALGPGLLESAYEACLAHELASRGLSLRRQLALPIVYEGLHLDAGFRIDLLVAEQVIVEIKAIEREQPVHVAQLLTYLRFSGKRLGFLLNFNVTAIKAGIRRVVL
ncbi:MAG: GxxExxY protein, partial [Alphaproteobacteria bacterium]|nr:GxxExxY protein [Alphaproteobacteria bacterium]